MFIDRKPELAALEKSWRSRRAALLICYGRRRVGKTELIKVFLRGKPAIYFLADRLSERDNLRALTLLTRDHFREPFLGDFRSWYDFFSYLKTRVDRRMALVVDEFPYLCETNKAVSSVFQKAWDEILSKLPIMLVLCGSSIGMMERETLAYGAPLYGRRTGQMRLFPLRFADFSAFFTGVSFDRRLQFYTMVGGIPAYIQQLSRRLSARQNLIEKILPPEAYLYNEADFILKEETREPRQYFSILRSISLGKRKFGEIVNETGIEKTSLHRYLYYLEELQIVEKRVPVTEKPEKSRRGLYFLNDNYFSFWFDIVFPYRSELVLGNLSTALARLDQAFVHHAATAYEQVAGEILHRLQPKLFPFARVGKWWDRENEIDVVALGKPGENVLFAEVKWSTKRVGVDVFEKLAQKSKLLPGDYRHKHYVLFSRSGFTPAMKKLARGQGILLIHGEREA